MRRSKLSLLLVFATLAALAAPGPAAAAPVDFAGVWSTSFYSTRVDPLGSGYEGRNQLDASDTQCEYVQQQAIWDIQGQAPEAFGKVIYPYRVNGVCNNYEVNGWFWIPPGGSGNILRVCVPEEYDPDAPAPVNKTSAIGVSTNCTDHHREATRAQLALKRTAFTYVERLFRGKCHRRGYLTYYMYINLGRYGVPADPIERIRIYARGVRVKAYGTIFRSGGDSVISFGNFRKTTSVRVKVYIHTARGRVLLRQRLFPRCYAP